ncbi:MAG: TetR/AcrR family transcriptional regulator [Saprospiraceae bacterium]|nr:TetR/AcrR family transcriptional regulator [Saprospiraceae bacterium]
MSKKESTRDMIVAKAAVLFNKQGFSGTSMSDLMEVTGLTKGGLYGNFKSKEEIAEAAFDYAVQQIWDLISVRTQAMENSVDKLCEVVRFYEEHITRPPIDGGCPILNAGAETDYHNTYMQPRVKHAISIWHKRLSKTIQKGIEKGEIKEDVVPEDFATIFIACIEGGALLSQVQKSNDHFSRIARFLQNELQKIRS